MKYNFEISTEETLGFFNMLATVTKTVCEAIVSYNNSDNSRKITEAKANGEIKIFEAEARLAEAKRFREEASKYKVEETDDISEDTLLEKATEYDDISEDEEAEETYDISEDEEAEETDDDISEDTLLEKATEYDKEKKTAKSVKIKKVRR